MVLSKTINVTVNSKIFKRYKELGYSFEKVGDEIEVDYQHLSKYSEEILKLRCDYCGKLFYRKYADHYRILQFKNNNINNKDCCYDCKNIKQEEINIKKFGVKNPFELSKVREKCIETIYNKYGVTNVSRSRYIQEKIKTNNLKKIWSYFYI